MFFFYDFRDLENFIENTKVIVNNVCKQFKK